MWRNLSAALKRNSSQDSPAEKNKFELFFDKLNERRIPKQILSDGIDAQDFGHGSEVSGVGDWTGPWVQVVIVLAVNTLSQE